MRNLIPTTIFFLLSTLVNAGEPLPVCTYSDSLVCGANTTVTKLGVVGEGYTVFNYTHVFGMALRAANRIVIVDSSGKFIGIYAVTEPASRIEGKCIVFPVAEEYGNTICLERGMFPKTAWVDGENPELFR